MSSTLAWARERGPPLFPADRPLVAGASEAPSLRSVSASAGIVYTTFDVLSSSLGGAGLCSASFGGAGLCSGSFGGAGLCSGSFGGAGLCST